MCKGLRAAVVRVRSVREPTTVQSSHRRGYMSRRQSSNPFPTVERESPRQLAGLLVPAALLAMVAVRPVVAGDPGVVREVDACQRTGEAAPDSALDAVASALEEGAVDTGRQMLRALAQSYPNDIRVTYALARAEQVKGDRLRAIAAAKASYALDASCRPVVRLLGELLEAQGDFLGAAGVYQHAVEQWPEEPELRRPLCRAWVAAGRLEAADTCLTELVSARPDDAGVLVMAAEVKGWLGAATDAVAAFERAMALDPTVMNAERCRTYGDALRLCGRMGEAIVQFDKALKIEPRDRVARLGRAYALLSSGRADEAVTAFRSVLGLDPEDVPARSGLARALHAAGREKEAITAYQDALERAPGDADLRREAVQITASVPSARPRALSLLQPLLEKQPPAAEDLLLQARILSWIPERRVEALAVLSRVLVLEPQFEQAWDVAREVALWSAPGPGLEAWLNRLHAHYPDDHAISRHLAAVLSMTPERIPEAMAMLERILESDPGDVDAELLRAELLSRQGSESAGEAAAGFQRAARLAPRDPAVQARAGRGLLALGDAEAALACFVRGHTVAPGDLECLLGRVEALVATDHYEEAVVLLTDSLAAARSAGTRARLSQRLASIQNRRTRQEAERLERSGRLVEAEALYRALLKKSPEDVVTWVGLGALQSRRGAFDVALGCFQQALAISRDDVGALQGAAGACIALGRYDDAERMVRRELELAPTQEARRRLERIELLKRIEEARRIESGGDRDSALAVLSELYLAHPEDPEVNLAYAEVLARVGRFDAAAEAYLRVTSLEPENVAAWNGAAACLWKAERKDDARRCLAELKRLSDEEGIRRADAQLLAWEVDDAEREKTRKNWLAAAEHYQRAYRMAPASDFVLKGIGGLYWSNGQVDLASKFYVQAATLFPEDIEASELAVETLLARDLPDVAMALVQSNLEVSRRPEFKALLEKVKLARDLSVIEVAWERGDRALAEALSDQIERDHPDDVEPRLRLAHLFAMNGRHTQAIRWYYKALERDPDHDTALLGLIASLQTMGRFVEADDLIRQARTREATTGRPIDGLDRLEAAGLAVKAEILQRRGMPAQALDAYVRAVALGFQEPWLLLNVARLYLSHDQPADALPIYDAVLQQQPDSLDALRGRAWALLALGRPDEMERAIDRLQELALPSVEDQILHAELTKLRGDLAGALDIYQDLYQAAPGDVGVVRGIVGCHLARNDAEAALSVMTGMLPVVIDDPVLLSAAATGLSALRRSDLAVPVLRRLSRYWPSPSTTEQLDAAKRMAYVEAAEQSKARRDLSRARQLYEEALARWPEHPDLWKGLAGVEATAHHNDRAVRCYRRALGAAPDDPVAVAGLASSRAAMGEVLAAIDELREEWNDGHEPEIGLALAELLVSQGRYAEAERVVSRLEEELGTSKEERSARLDRGPGGLAPETAPTVATADHFFDRWRDTPKGLPAKTGAHVPGEPLPAWTPRVKERADDGAGTLSAEAVSTSGRVILPDIAPEIPLPSRSGPAEASNAAGTEKQAEPTATRLDLRLVEQLLTELQTDPQAVVRNVEKDEGGTWSAGGGSPPVLLGTEGNDLAPSQPSGVGEGGTGGRDEDEPFVPEVALANGGSGTRLPMVTPLSRLESLRKQIIRHRAPRFRVEGSVDTRSGEPATTERFAAFGNVRARFYPTPSLYFEPFVSPGVVSDSVHSAQGVRPGLAFGLRPGRFGLDGVVGTSALGFPGDVYPVGRVGLTVDLANRVGIALDGAIEPVTDTYLSWVGRFEEASQSVVGKVSRSRLGGTLNLALDGSTSLSMGGDLGRYAGSFVEENAWRNGRLSLDHRVATDTPGQVRAGINVTAFGFEKQLDGFSLQPDPYEQKIGGYFSPRLFIVAKARGVYSQRAPVERFGYHLALELGTQYTVCNESALCSPGLKPAFLFELGASYALSRGLEFGAAYLFDNVGANYRHQFVEIHLEKRFGGQ